MPACPLKCALVSVSDKTGVVPFVRQLTERGVRILSTGGTAKLLKDERITVVEVSDHTEFPEIMDGRLKTLHPKIHGGLLGRRGVDDAVMSAHGIEPIDLVVVNLYPFAATIDCPNCTFETALKNIDIGGPAMIRAAAKNHASVGVVVDTADYDRVIADLDTLDGMLADNTRFYLAQKAFAHTARYDATIANYLGAFDGSPNGKILCYPSSLSLQFDKHTDLRYGENPHQSAAFYAEAEPPSGTLATARQRQGKMLSYNNIADADAALECVLALAKTACVIVKHGNPCGVALGDTPLDAYNRAYATDPTSAFGGIIALNCPVDADTAQEIIERQFVEVIVASSVTEDALHYLSKKNNIRVLEVGTRQAPLQQLVMKRVSGGLLVQDYDATTVNKNVFKIVSKRTPTEQEQKDLSFAWQVVKQVKSNAIVYAKNGRTIGIGAGQMSRVQSAKIATLKAADEGLELTGSVLASDAFLPFPDVVKIARDAGATALIQPGGSQRDNDVIDAADSAGLAMMFTGQRHFLH